MSIPKILHQLWIGPRNPPLEMMQTWRDKHPSFEYIFWNEEEIARRGMQFRCQTQIDEMIEWNGKADMMRWEILYHYGGYFADADSICIEPFDEYFEQTTAFATFENEILRAGLVATGTMGFIPNHPLCRDIIDWMVSPDAVEILETHRAWGSVGPHRLTEFLNTGNYKDFTVFPSHCFLPIHFSGDYYDGHKKVYAYQLWGNTNDLYESKYDTGLPLILREPTLWVSLLIPFYNVPAYQLKECFESILLQRGHFGIEFVFINDGSDPEYTAILEEAIFQLNRRARFCRYIYHHIPNNSGIANALYHGIQLCNQELIFRMDADDIMLPCRIQTQITFMQNHPECMICGSNMRLFYNNVENLNEKISICSTSHIERLEWSEFVNINPRPHWIMNHPTLCFRKTAVLEVGNYRPEIKGTEDYDLEIRFMERYGAVYNLKDELLLYRAKVKI
jgi:hypothetical protein